MSQIRCLPAGDMALNVDFGSEISEPVNNQVQSLMQALDDVCIPGIIGSGAYIPFCSDSL